MITGEIKTHKRLSCFLCVFLRLGGVILKNKDFNRQTTKERTAKLTSVIRARTNGALSDENLRDLLENVSPERQYAITVHADPDSFCQALVLTHSNEGCDHGKIAFGEVSLGNRYGHGYEQSVLHQERHKAAAAVISRGTQDRTTYEIRIFIPETTLANEGGQELYG